MKCHYEVLNVSKDATDDDLKKSYRKLALKWHPDKNPENTEEAKHQFQLIQQAYDVLTDPQERSWYDKHRDAILRGGLDGDYEDDCLNVYQYFTTTCFKGYENDNEGFYCTYAEIFNTIGKEDMDFVSDSDSEFHIPEFGNSNSSYEDVVKPFYDYWINYTTKKSYTWLYTYDIRTAPNRRVIKLMEKENKKIRDQARKERNDEVRALIAFVRKRDKRILAYAQHLEQQAKEKEKKAEENRLKQFKRRQEEIATYEEAEWSKFSNFELELKEIEANLNAEHNDASCDSSNYNSEQDDSLYCPACNKLFKTDKAFTNHEKSKKHKENVAALKIVLEQDDQDLMDNSEDEFLNESFQENKDDSVSVNDDLENIKTKKSKKQKKKQRLNKLAKNSLDTSDEEDNQEKLNSISDIIKTDSKVNQEKSVTNLQDDTIKTRKPRKKNNVKTDEYLMQSGVNNIEESDKEVDKRNVKLKNKKYNQKQHTITAGGNCSTENVASINKLLNSVCAKCSETFKSKNELFKHLRQSGHAVFIRNIEQNKKENCKNKKK